MLSKLKNKKTIAIAAMSVLVVIAAAAFLLTCAPRSSLMEVPPDWTKIEDAKLSSGAYGVVYQGTGTLESALGVFKASLEKTGWVWVRDTLQADLYSATLNKGSQQAEILVMRAASNITAYILVYEARAEEAEKPDVPKTDIAGEDFPDIPRYAGAIRTKYETGAKESLVGYLAPADAKTVADWYVNQLLANGWLLQAVTIENVEATIISFKTVEQALATVSIKTSKVFADYTSIQITKLTIN